MISGERRISQLVARHRKSGILIDTNLLLLWLIGLFDLRRVPDFRRTKRYTQQDFRILYQFVDQFDRIIVTPHILTEVSNLAPSDRRYNFFRLLDTLLANQPGRLIVDEQHRPAAFIRLEPEFYRLGLTDAGIIHRARHKRYLVLTDDEPLGERLTSHRIDFLTLEDLRSTASP